MSTAREHPDQTAQLLIEALPYIRQFADSVVVVKYGGNALAGGDEASALASFAQDIVLLQAVGIRPRTADRRNAQEDWKDLRVP